MERNESTDNNYQNFEKADVIQQLTTPSAHDTQQVPTQALNQELYEHLMRFIDSMQHANRPKSMADADKLFQTSHGARVHELNTHLANHGKIVALPCYAIPPELVYAIPNAVPIPVSAGGAGISRYASEQLAQNCSLIRSLSGFAHTGMSMFYNQSTHLLFPAACHAFAKLPNAIPPGKSIHTTSQTAPASHELQHTAIGRAIYHISPEGLQTNRLRYYASLYTQIRNCYQQINETRKHPQPPIDGQNALWLQQLYPAIAPENLLPVLQKVVAELQQRIQNGLTPAKQHTKRVLLIANRQMPPFAQVYQLIENHGGIVVRERSCMGTESVAYSLPELQQLLGKADTTPLQLVTHLFSKPNQTAMACSPHFSLAELQTDITDYQAEAVLIFGIDNCPTMQLKARGIQLRMRQLHIPVLHIEADYASYYRNEAQIGQQIADFLGQINPPNKS